MSQRVVITGANRGLGLELTKRYLERGDTVFALARKPGESKALQDLSNANPETLTLVTCDVSDDPSVAKAASEVLGRVSAIDLLINNAGVNSGASGSFASAKLEDVLSVMQVNLLGPWRVTRAFVDKLKGGQDPKVVQISSLMGSMADNSSGGSWSYRISKTALNMFNRNLAHELPGVTVVAFHPGWVQTDMGGSSAPLTIEESVAAMMSTIDELSTEHTGGFYDRNGERLPY
ncbi:MAG: SDR family oxidoreductase [Planctomycetota bacterium]